MKNARQSSVNFSRYDEEWSNDSDNKEYLVRQTQEQTEIKDIYYSQITKSFIVLTPKCARLIPEPKDGVLQISEPVFLDSRFGDLRFSEMRIKSITAESKKLIQIFVQIGQLTEKNHKSHVFSFLTEIALSSANSRILFYKIDEVISPHQKGMKQTIRSQGIDIGKKTLDLITATYTEPKALDGHKIVSNIIIVKVAGRIFIYSAEKTNLLAIVEIPVT